MQQARQAGLRVKCFGRFEVYRDGVLLSPKDWGRRKTKTLLKVLLSGRVFTQDQLIEYLFPNLDPHKAIKNLLGRVGELRRALEPGLPKATDSQYIINAGQGGYLFGPDAPICLDTEEFEKQSNAAQAAESAGRWPEALAAYQKAVCLYQGDYLAEDLYEEWTLAPREHWQELYLTALARLAECHARLGQYGQAIERCRRLLELKPTKESVYRQKMLYHALAGDQSEALQTYQACVKVLQEHLEVQPASETCELYEQFLQGKIPSVEVYPPPLTPARHNLPNPLTNFIGRQREIAEVKRLLSTTRLLTLTGAGGCGKTRLSLQIARVLLAEYTGGIWLVDLAPLADAQLIPQALALVFGLREESGGRPLIDTLVDYLCPQSLLLILDNCEHLLSASVQLVDALLRRCPDLKILATSRESFDILGELVYPVPSLSLPDPGPLPMSLKQLMRYDALHLFIERAAFSRPEFVLTKENAPTVAQICHRLDGIALAIELAAAQLKALSLEEVAQRLDDCFRLLTSGNRAALPRHQTLRAALDWSFNLLSEAERTLLLRLSVFTGGFPLEAVEAVCAGKAGEGHEVLDLLTHLVDQSLVWAVKGEKARYRLLETVRQYSQDKLCESGERESLLDRHLDFFLRLAERASPELDGPDQEIWLELLEREHDNMRVALAWSLGRGEAALRLGYALWWFWYIRGYLTEGRDWLAKVLATSSRAPTVLRARVLNGAGRLACEQGDYAVATSLHKESMAIYRELGDKRGIASQLNNLGIVASHQGSHATAGLLYEQGLVIHRALGNKLGVANTLCNLGSVAFEQGDYALAHSRYEKSLALYRELWDIHPIATTLSALGLVAQAQGNYEQATALQQESLALLRKLGNKQDSAYALSGLGSVAQCQGDYEKAAAWYEESLALRQELGDRQRIADSLTSLGSVAQCQGHYERSVRLHAESLALFQKLGSRKGVATALSGLGKVAQCQGDYERATAMYKESLTLRWEMGEKGGVVECLEGLTEVACAQGCFQRAARLSGAAESLREVLGSPLPPNVRAGYEGEVTAVRAKLGEEAFAGARAEGQGLTLGRAVDYALEK